MFAASDTEFIVDLRWRGLSQDTLRDTMGHLQLSGHVVQIAKLVSK